MALNHIQSGKVIDYTNSGSADIVSGRVVVIGTLVGVALVDIAVGKTGSVAIEEVYSLPKVTGAIAQGAKVYWAAAGDPVGGVAGSGALTTTASGNTLAGIAAIAAASGDATVALKLNAA